MPRCSLLCEHRKRCLGVGLQSGAIRARCRAHELLINIIEFSGRIVGIVTVLINVLRDDVLHTSVISSRTAPSVSNCAEKSVAIVLHLAQQSVVTENTVRPRRGFASPRRTATLDAEAPFERRKQIQLVPLAPVKELVDQAGIRQILTQVAIEGPVIVLRDRRRDVRVQMVLEWEGTVEHFMPTCPHGRVVCMNCK